MNQSPWSRKVPPKPPSGPNGRPGLGGNIGASQNPTVPSPPNRPPGASGPSGNTTPYKKPDGKKRNGFKIPDLKRTATVLSVIVALVVGGVLVQIGRAHV